MTTTFQRRSNSLRAMSMACALGVMAVPLGAAEISPANAELKIRWDNTVRYNLGTRVESADARLLASRAHDEGDSKFKRGELVAHRLDLLSEIDISYRGQFGLRLVGAAWYDAAYNDRSVRATAAGGYATSYLDDRYNRKVSRYVNGPSAELLDAFAWTNFNLGHVPVNVKLGRHAVIWGEGVLIGAHALSYAQAPTDAVKALASPGIETKELLLPVNQLSFKAQLSSDITLAGQYFLEWKPLRAPNGGTFLAGSDTSPSVDRLAIAPGVQANVAAPLTPGNIGNWGLSVRLNAASIDAVVGLYYREFNDYAPESGVQFLTFAGNLPTSLRFVYPRGVKQYSLSVARPWGPVSVGGELSLRTNGALNSTGSYGPNQTTGARGDTWHAIVNGTYLLPRTALFDTGSLLVELAYSRLRHVTANAQLYRAEGNLLPMNETGSLACSRSGAAATAPGSRTDACSTRDFLQLAVSFSPSYLGVAPSWDLEFPMFASYGVKGTAPSATAGFEKLLTFSLGAKLTYAAVHEFSLRYADTRVPTKYSADGTTVIGGNGPGGSIGATDRGWLAFTYKTSF